MDTIFCKTIFYFVINIIYYILSAHARLSCKVSDYGIFSRQIHFKDATSICVYSI